MPRTFALTRKTPYYRRHRALPMVGAWREDGSAVLTPEVDALVTRYGYQLSRYRRPTDVYAVRTAANVWLVRIRSVPVAMGPDGAPAEWAHAWEPIGSASAVDRYPAHREPAPFGVLRIRGGLPVGMGADEAARALGLDRPRRRGPRRAAA